MVWVKWNSKQLQLCKSRKTLIQVNFLISRQCSIAVPSEKCQKTRALKNNAIDLDCNMYRLLMS